MSGVTAVALHQAERKTGMDEVAAAYSGGEKELDMVRLEDKGTRGGMNLHGEGLPNELRAMEGLATTLESQERWNEAEAPRNRILEAYIRSHGEGLDSTLIVMNELAATYAICERWADAEVLEAKILKMHIERHGDGHAKTINGMDHLAITYRRQEGWAGQWCWKRG